jgi:hypothetical protein
LLIVYLSLEPARSFTGTHPIADEGDPIVEVLLPHTDSNSLSLQQILQVIDASQVIQFPSLAIASCFACSAICEPPPETRLDKSKAPCSYHGPILNLIAAQSKEQLLPIDRFLSDGPGMQCAIFVMGVCGHVSINKGCTCDNIGPKLEMLVKEEGLGDNGTEIKIEETAKEV